MRLRESSGDSSSPPEVSQWPHEHEGAARVSDEGVRQRRVRGTRLLRLNQSADISQVSFVIRGFFFSVDISNTQPEVVV